MFSRGSSSDPSLPKPPSPPSGLAGPVPSSGNGRASPFGAAAAMGTSVIGTDLTILGEKITIISQNKLQIDGDIRGDVTGKQVVIGEDGSVIGTVCAEQIEVRGGVRGAIKAQSVTLHPTSVVEGDIFHQTLSISEGAQFDGRVRRAKDTAEIAPNLDVNSYPAPSQPAAG
ncbi:bactofilin family protein [Hyphomicrobium sp.]|uniref:bactofilin family protein n=1 Tax=Hyphomicrobium sp. TaxID=82 RepID=UPI002FDF21E1